VSYQGKQSCADEVRRELVCPDLGAAAPLRLLVVPVHACCCVVLLLSLCSFFTARQRDFAACRLA
jgi:hypothetical protein